MPFLRLFLDSSTLRANLTPESSALKRLEVLAQSDVISVHIHSLVVREVITGLTADLAKSVKGLKQHSHWLAQGPEDSKGIEALLGRNIQSLVTDNLKTIVYRLRAREHSFAPDAAEAVFANYFSGMGPFSAPKIRADIPDAFILHELSANNDHLPTALLTADQRLRKAAEALGIIVFADPKAFLDSDELETALQEFRDDEADHDEALRELNVAENAREQVREIIKQGCEVQARAISHAKDAAREEPLCFRAGSQSLPEARLAELGSRNDVSFDVDWVGSDWGECDLGIKVSFPEATIAFDSTVGAVVEGRLSSWRLPANVMDAQLHGKASANVTVSFCAHVTLVEDDDSGDRRFSDVDFESVDVLAEILDEIVSDEGDEMPEKTARALLEADELMVKE